MSNSFTDYPILEWKEGWSLSAEPGDDLQLLTAGTRGELIIPQTVSTLQLIPQDILCNTRLFSNAVSLQIRKHKMEDQVDAVLLEPGVLTGSYIGFPPPELNSESELVKESGISCAQKGQTRSVLICRESRFALVTGTLPQELAMAKAEEAIEIDIAQIIRNETERRERTAALFSINPRHNPPVVLAAESLRKRLRPRNAAIHGLWSLSEGFETEAFSLNELYPLVRAWRLIDPSIALELIQTTLSLQQSNGGFPAWVAADGTRSSAAPWPMIIQSFEHVWEENKNSVLLKKTLPALRKYIQWALRRFDPYRDGIPAWQSEQEVFVPESHERNKATPELTAFFLGELDALLRLCADSDHSETAEDSLTATRDELAQTLTTTFWNPQTKEFSNVWKDGHYIHEPSFGSFMPLFWDGLNPEYKTPLLEKFEETHGFPGKEEPAGWKHEQIDDPDHLPAIHQFMAFESLRKADTGRALLMLFVRRARDGFFAWFERESNATDGRHTAYALGPITAALILTTQHEFKKEAQSRAPTIQHLLSGVHKLRITKADLRIVLIFGLLILFIHLLYNLPRIRHLEQTRMAEAVLNYRAGNFREAFSVLQAYPENPLSRLLRANLLILTEQPREAEELYHKTLLENPESPAALFGYALSLQMNQKYEQAVRRYNDFIDIYEADPTLRELSDIAYQFLLLADKEFSKPPAWRRVYTLPAMNDLGL